MFSGSSRKSIRPLPFVFVMMLACTAADGGAQTNRRQPNGAIVPLANGMVQVEVCSESVIHVVVGATSVPIKPLVPTVVRPCTGTNFTTSSDDSGFHLQTSKLK